MQEELDVKMVTVDASNVEEQGFFCYKSKRKAEGYRCKSNWLAQRFEEGLQIKMLYEGRRSIAFVEYIPGEYGWRAVDAAGYMLIHCLWVVGKGKGKGYALRLLDACMEEAQARQLHGVAMVTSKGHWLVDKKVFIKNGFTPVAQAPPSFELLVKRVDDAPLPAFPQNWDERAARYGDGLTVVYADQCPYIPDATKIFQETAAELGIPFCAVRFENSRDLQENSPSAYGIFNVVYQGKLLTYHYAKKKDLLKLLAARGVDVPDGV